MTISTETFVVVNTGSSANDGTGDSIRAAFVKVNQNFSNIENTGFDTGNINVNGSIECAGNIVAPYFVGDGTFLSNVVGTYDSTDVAAYLPSYTGNLNSVSEITTSGDLVVVGGFATFGERVIGGYQKYSPTANVSITANVDVSHVIITPTNIIPSFGAIVTLPNITFDGTTVSVSANVTVEHLSVNGQWTSTVSPTGNISLTAGTSATYFYHATDIKWYKIG